MLLLPLLILATSVDLEATLRADGTLHVEERWDAGRPERFLELQGIASIQVHGAPAEVSARWVHVPPGETNRLVYDVVGASHRRADGGTELVWLAWASAQPTGVHRIRASIAFEVPTAERDVRVELAGGAGAPSWRWVKEPWHSQGECLVCEFEEVSPGDPARIVVLVPSRTASPPFLWMPWLKSGGASEIMFGLPLATLLLLGLLHPWRRRDPRRGRRWEMGIGFSLALGGVGFLVPALEANYESVALACGFLTPVLLLGVSLNSPSARKGRLAAVAAAAIALGGLVVAWPPLSGLDLPVFVRLAIGLLAAGAVAILFAPAAGR